jgi:hypothetical protein
MAGNYDLLLARLGRDPRYAVMFASAFAGEKAPITIDNVARALASFERTLISARSPYDRLVLGGDSNALPAPAWRGMRLFFSPRLRCSICHGGIDLSSPANGQQFQNTGLYDRKMYRSVDPGLSARSGRRADLGKFRIPSLRNVAVTAPYMHDGSTPSLSQVIDDYAAGGRAARLSGKRPERGVAVKPFPITAAEKADLLAFLESLTDDAFLSDPRYANPWPVKGQPQATEGCVRPQVTGDRSRSNESGLDAPGHRIAGHPVQWHSAHLRVLEERSFRRTRAEGPEIAELTAVAGRNFEGPVLPETAQAPLRDHAVAEDLAGMHRIGVVKVDHHITLLNVVRRHLFQPGVLDQIADEGAVRMNVPVICGHCDVALGIGEIECIGEAVVPLRRRLSRVAPAQGADGVVRDRSDEGRMPADVLLFCGDVAYGFS